MRKPTHTAAQAIHSNPEPGRDATPIGGFELVKLVRIHVPIYAGESGVHSIGRLLDAHMEETALAGEELQSVTLNVSPEHWESFATLVNQSHHTTSREAYD